MQSPERHPPDAQERRRPRGEPSGVRLHPRAPVREGALPGTLERPALPPGVDLRDNGRVGLPEIFGPYTLLRRLARGGWASVYEARVHDARSTLPASSTQATRVALKRLEQTTPEAIQRMTREGALLKGFSSARIPRLLEQGQVDGVPFLALEYIDGVDLATLLHRLKARQQPLPTEMLLELLLQVGLALRVAHTWIDPEQQRPVPIVHGDLKPANVLIGRDGRVLLTDFGSAQPDGTESEGLARISGSDGREGPPGTIGYVAPERVRLAMPGPVSSLSDLFSLGLVAFELGTLTPLFSGSPAQMLQQALQAEQFVPMALTRLPPELHPQVVEVIRALLAPRPEQRTGHVDDALRPLQELQVKLNLKADLAGFIGPYLEPGPGESLEIRVTGNPLGLELEVTALAQSQATLAENPVSFKGIARLTRLTRKQLEALIPPPAPRPLTLAGALETQRRRRRSLVLRTALVLLLCGLGALFLLWSLPVHLEVKTTPAGGLVSLQPGCEGAWSAAQLAPATLRTRGPWPVCVGVDAPGFMRVITRVLQPPTLSRSTLLNLTLEREVCVRVGSRPPGLPVYVDNRARGNTSLDDLKVCGLTPFEPYMVQIEYDGSRLDVQEIVGKPGEELRVFQDFALPDPVIASPFERCVRTFSAGELERAIELCRVAVVQAPDLEQKLTALLIQGRAFAGQEDVEAACDLFGVALDRAVDSRRLSLERRVVDARAELDCETVEAERALREEAEANGTAEEPLLGVEPHPAASMPAASMPAASMSTGTIPVMPMTLKPPPSLPAVDPSEGPAPSTRAGTPPNPASSTGSASGSPLGGTAPGEGPGSTSGRRGGRAP